VEPRDAGLAVHDINSYMARFRPAARATADKGHPDGPRLEPRVKPRLSTAQMDNSLRTLDIEGTRCVARRGFDTAHACSASWPLRCLVVAALDTRRMRSDVTMPGQKPQQCLCVVYVANRLLQLVLLLL
jgi:hypothetical protein